MRQVGQQIRRAALMLGRHVELPVAAERHQNADIETPVVAVLQATYCVVCLPYSRQTPSAQPKPGQKRKAPKQAQELWARIVV